VPFQGGRVLGKVRNAPFFEEGSVSEALTAW